MPADGRGWSRVGRARVVSRFGNAALEISPGYREKDKPGGFRAKGKKQEGNVDTATRAASAFSVQGGSAGKLDRVGST